jgi:peptidoglycan/LPS O-acetylase OafA/YrhL
MGIAYARYMKRTLSSVRYLLIVLFSAVGVVAGSMSVHTWLWVPLFITTGAVATVKLLPQWLMKPCAWFGGISAALFVMHPVMRELVISHYRRVDIYWGIAIYLLSAVALSMLLQYFIQRKR